MKNSFRIIATNWINFIGIFVSVYAYAVLSAYIDSSFNLFQAMLSALILTGLYGLLFWIGFLIIISLLDIILIVKTKNNLKPKLIIEWFLISIPFIYWTIKYNKWIFLVGIIAFFISQMLREQRVKKILSL